MNCRIWKSGDTGTSPIGNLCVTYASTLALAAFLFLAMCGSASAQTYSTWTHSKFILFNTTSGGANVAGNLANFPVLVRLNSTNFDFGEALTNGQDIRFEDRDGTPLSYHIERWDAGAQVAEIWVRVPQVDGNSPNDLIRMYYGKIGATSESNGANVFPIADNFGGVWHLNQDGNTAAGGYPDATTNAYHGTGTGMTAVSDVPAISGIGQEFNGTTQYIDFGAGTNLRSSSTLTLEAWVKVDVKATKATFLSKPYTSNTTPFDEYFLGLDGSTGAKFMFAVTIASTNYTLLSTMTPSTGVWYHVVGQYDGSNMKLYVNGTMDASSARTGAIDSYSQSLRAGRYGATANYLDGMLDEVRVSTSARSADWLKASFANQQTSQNLVVMAPRVWDGGGADPLWSNPLNWNGDVLPTPDEEVLFDGTSIDDATLDMNVSVKSITFTAGYTGNFSFSSYILTVNQAQADFRSGGAITPGTGTLRFTGVSSQNLHPHSSANLPSVVQDGSGTTTIVSYPAFMGNLSINAGTLNLGSGFTHSASTLTAGSGTLNFGSSTLSVSGNVNLGSLSVLTAGAGTLGFTAASGTQTFTPKVGATHPGISKSGAGTVAVSTNGLTAGALNLTAGTWDWGASSLTHSVTSIATSGSSTMTFGSNTVVVNTGDCNLTGLATLNPGTGYLNFSAAAGGQAFTPKAGATHPHITKTGAGTVTVTSNALIAKDLAMTAGSWDWGVSTLTHSIQNLSTGGTPSMTFGSNTVQISNGADFSGLATLSPGSGTIEMVGASSQTLTPKSGATHPNLKLSGSATTAFSTSDMTVGNLDINSGTLNTNSRGLYVGGNLTIAGGTLSAGGAIVDVDGNLTVTTGALTCPAGFLNVGGSFVQSGGTLTHSSGTVALDGTLPGKTLNVIGTLNALLISGTGGLWTVTTNGLAISGNLSVSSGTLALGSGLSHSVGSLSTSGGTLDFGSCTFSITTGNADMSGLTTLTPGTGNMAFSGSGAQTFIPRSGSTHPAISKSGVGTVTLSTNDLTTTGLTASAGGFNQSTRTVTVSGNLSVSGGTYIGTNGTLYVNGDFTLSSGAIQMPSGTMYVGGNISRTAGTVTHNNGWLTLNGAATGKTFDFSPTLYNLNVAGTGGAWTAVNNGFNVVNLFQVQAGTFNLGAALVHSAETINSTGGSLDFGSSTLNVAGITAYLDGLATLTAGSGTLGFQASSGIQSLYAKAGSTNPHISHSAAGTLRLMTNNLTCLSFAQTAGILDFNALNISTVTSGNFSLTNGTASSVSGLAGRTLTVAGNATLSGAVSTSRLNLNPGTAWTLAVTGSLTGSLVSLDNSNASVTAGSCSNCANGGSTTNWTFAVAWDGGGVNSNWSTPGNWASDYVPTPLDAVTFNATSLSAILDAAATVKSITFTSGYTGTFSFSTNTLSVTGNADFQSGGPISAGTGTLAFTGSSAQTFIPKSSTTHPAIVQNGAGGTTITTNQLEAGNLTVTSGALNLGAGLSHYVGGVSGSGTLNFNTSDLTASGNVDLSGLTVSASAGKWMTFNGSSAQTFTPNTSVTNLQVQQSGTGGTTVLGYGFTTPWLSVGLGTLNLGTGLTHTVTTTLTLSGGGIDFASSTLQVNAAAANFTSLASLTAGSGTLAFTGTSAQTFTPKASFTFPAITQSGSGGTTLATNNLTGGSLSISGGTFDLGSSLSHIVAAVSTSGGGLVFNNSTLGVNTGNAVFSGLTTLTAGTGTLAFLAATGTQSVEAKSATTHPHITHTSAGILRLMNASMSCLSFTQSAGTFNFNNYNLTTVSSGNFTLNNGTSTSIAGLGGRILTVAGNAAFNGASSADRLNLNPGFTWWLNVTGTASANLATVDFGNASGGSTASCSNCANAGSNSNWSFNVTWDGGGADNNWTTAANWGSDYVPTSSDDILFNGTSTDNANLDVAASVRSITFDGNYTGIFTFSNTLTVNTGNADFRSGLGIVTSSGGLTMTGASPQMLYPGGSSNFGIVTQNGAGGTTISGGNLFADGGLVIQSGTLDLGTGRTHTVASISGTGGLSFSTSNLNATGNVDLSGLTVTASSSNTLAFTGSAAQTYAPKASVTALNLTQNGSGGTTVSTYSFTTPTLAIATGTLNLGAGLTHTVTTTLSATGGGLDFGSSILKVQTATVNISALATLTAGSGTLEFAGASAQTFTPKASTTHPQILQSGAGGVTIATNDLITGTLTLTGGTYALGAGRTTSTTGLSLAGGTLDFTSGTLQTSATSINLNSVTLSGAASGNLEFTGSAAKTFTPKTGFAAPNIIQSGTGITTVASYPLSTASMTFSGGEIEIGTLALTTNAITITSGSLTANNGSIDLDGNLSMTGGSLKCPSAGAFTVTGNIGIATAATVYHYSGTITLDGAATGRTLDIGDTLYGLNVNGTGGEWTVTGNPVLLDGPLTMTAGSLLLGTGLTSFAGSIASTGGTLDFGSSTLRIRNTNANLSGLTTLTPGTGTLQFISTSANQTLTPKSGVTHPAISHTGSTVLEISAYDLICKGFSNAGGGLNFNGRNITVDNGGDFSISNGTPTTVSNLGGSTITVAGNASFSGTSSASPLNLNPGTAWTLAVTGSLTGNLVSLNYSNASASAGACTNCANGGNNSNWAFTVAWDGGGADSNWNTSANWGSDAVPTAGDDVVFNSTSSINANLDVAATVKSITISSGYTGTFSFLNNTLSVSGNADFRSGGPVSADTGTLAMTGTAAQALYNKSGLSFGTIVQNGAGGTTFMGPVTITAGGLVCNSGTFYLSTTGYGHSIDSISGSGGGLDFQNSSVYAGKNIDLSGITVSATSVSLIFNGTSAQTYTPNASVTGLRLTQNGTGGTTVLSNSFTTPYLSITSGTLNLGAGLSHSVTTTLSIAGGGLDFGSSTLGVGASTVDFASLATLNPGTGTLAFTRASGSGMQAFTPKSSLAFPTIRQNGTAGTYIAANNLTATAISLSSGSMDLGLSTVTVDSITSTGGGISSNGIVHILTGNLSLGSITSQGGNATYSFEAASGTQVFTPMSGSTYYSIIHAGAGTLRLATNPLACYFFSQTAGTFDFNGLNLTIANTTGSNITVTNGTPTSFTGLAGRTLTVNGFASFSGSSAGSKINLNPGSAWILNVTGALTGSLASIANSNASGSAASGNCSNCENLGSNTNWNFALSWVGGGGNSNWTTAANWGSNSVPGTADAVSFTATANDATLDAPVSVKSITMTSGYTGAFSFGSQTLTVNSGNADFRSGGTITTGTGTLAFTSTSTQTFIPKTGALFPALTLNGTGGVTLSTNSLTAGDLTLTSGNLTLGTGMTHSVGNIVPGTGGGIIFGNSTLQASGASVSFANLGTLNYGTGTLEFTGTSAQSFTGKSGVFHPDIRQNGSGGTTLATNNWTTGTLTIAAGTWSLGTGRSIVANNFSATGGGIDFGSSTLEINGASADFSSLAAVTAGTGTLMFGGGSAQTFTPKAGATFPNIKQYGSGGTTIASNNLTAGSLTLNQGTFGLGSSLSHTFASVNDGGGGPYGNLNFGSSQLHVTGNVTLGNVPTLTPGTGTLAFDGASGTQVFIPVSGGVSHPVITHTGAATLQLATNNLSCLGFSQSAGTLDLNGMNITTTGSGSFAVTNGTATSLVGLSARTLTVAGNASFTGTSASNRIAMNPGAAWTLAVTGSLTAQHATLGDNTASVSAGTCSDCGDAASNVNWTMPVTWDGGGAGTAWTTAANWGSDAVPTSNQDVLFNATSLAATLDAATTIKSITFTTGYTGAFDFSSNTLTIASGNADFRSGGAFTPGTGTLAFAGSSSQAFIPKSGSSFPNILKTGSGTTTVTTYALSAGDLTVNAGTFHLGSSLAHAVDSIGGLGTLDFGTSTLNATGNANLSGLTVSATAANTLAFTGSAAQTFTPKASVTTLNLTQNGAGGTTVLAYGFTTPTLAIASGTLNLGSGLTHSVSTTLSLTGGGLDFASSSLQVQAGTVNLNSLATLTAGSGSLAFTGASPQTLVPKAATLHPILIQNGTGGTSISTFGVGAAGLSIVSGTFSLGSGATHTFSSLGSSGGGLDFASATLNLTGSADFGGLATLTEGTGTLNFTGAAGVALLTPRASDTLPAITHSGSDTLRLFSADLVSKGFTQSSGTLDLNGRNITLIGSGNLAVTGGTSASFKGLRGRTLTVGGNASLAGTSSANRLGLDPDSAWTLAVTGSLAASHSTLANNTASLSAGACTDCANSGGNTNWTSAVSWDGGAGDNKWSTALNWGSDYVPTSDDDVTFNATSIGADLDISDTVKSITFTTGYTGAFGFSSNTLTIATGNADFRSGGAFTPGTGTMAFAGSSSQAFIPKSGSTFPNIFKTGSGTTTVTTFALFAGDLTVNAGTFHLGSSLAHTVDSIGGVGTLDFGTSTLNATGNANLSGLTIAATTANTLAFTGSTAQSFTPKASVTALNLTQNGAGTTTVLAYGFTTPTLAIASGTLDLGAGLSHVVGTGLNLTGGGLSFNTSTLATAAATVDLRNLDALTPGSGVLGFTGTSAQSFIPRTSGTLPALIQSGAGGTTVSVNAVNAGALTISGGSFNLGSPALTHSVASLATTGGGLTINDNTLDITTGDADFSGLSTLVPGTGIVSFSAVSDTQVLTPKASTSLPRVTHLGAGTLRLAVNALTCIAYEQYAGSLDFNGLNVTTTPGDFTLQNGTPTSLVGLAGRTLTVGGNATFDGTSGSNRINLDPGSAWTLAATGTVSASFATLANSNATASGGLATNSVDNGGNTGWTFAITWSGAGTNENWSTAANWASNAVPGASVNVVFNGTGVKSAVLDAAGAVKSILFTSGYTGDFSFSGNTLTVAGGDADFRSGGAINAGSGALAFTSSGPQEFHPKSGAVFPNLIQNGPGVTSLLSNTLYAGNLAINSGTFRLGSALNHSVDSISGTGTLDFGDSHLYARGKVDFSSLTLTTTPTTTLGFTGATAQTYIPKAGSTAPNINITGTGGVTVSGSSFTVSNLSMSTGSLNLGTGLTHAVTADFNLTGGTLNFNTSTLQVSTPSVDLTALTALSAGTGTLQFTGASPQSFIPKASATHPAIVQSGAGGTTVATRDLSAGNLNITGGTWSLGTGLTHLVSNIASSAGGLSFGSSTLQVAGNANLGGLSALTPGTGNIVFIASSGTQVFTPAAGATYPSVAHTGAGILQFSTNPLTCASFYQSAGTLDFNGQNLSTAGAGDIAVTGGTTSSFTGLAGRTLTIGGNATFTGQTGNLINLNPPSAWTLAVGGILSATLAQVANCNASSAAGDGVSSVDGGGNTNWAFSVTWDGGGANENWTTGGNWSSDVIPAASTKVIFDATSPKDCQLDGAVTVKAIRFDNSYTGGFFFNTNTLNVTSDADFRSGGAIVAGSGSLSFAGSIPQTFIPKAAAAFPGIIQNGAGGTTLSQNGLNAAALSLMNGTLNLGQGLTHAVASVGGSGGGLDFAGSTLKVTGNTDLSALSAVTAGTGRLEFTGSTTQTFSPKASAGHPRIAQTGTGTTTLSANGLTTTSLRIAAGGLNLGAGLSHQIADTLIGSGGILDFGSSTLKTSASAPNLSGLAAIVPGTGTLEFSGASPQTFTPKAAATHPALTQNGIGGTTLAASLSGGNLSIVSGTLNLGNGFSHSFAGLASTGGGLDFGGSLLATAGSADFSGLSTLVAGTGTLSFTAASGTHVFVPKNGAVHPLIAHHAADTLRLSANSLSALGFAQTAGVLDLNGYDLTLAASGNLELSGGSLPILGLGGRTLSVGGNARFAGTASTKLDLNPASAWTLAVGGSLSAVNIRLRNSLASVSAGVADSSLNLGGNANWTFLDSIKPDNVSNFLASATGGTSAALSWTPTVSEDADSVMIRYRTDGAYPATAADGTLWRKVPAAKSTDTANGLAEKTVYHFAAFVKDSSGNYSPSVAGAQDSTRTPDVTPPANVASLVASAVTTTSAALAWTPSGSPDADTVMIRYLAGTVHPANSADGLLWKKLPIAFVKDTITGLTANTVYAFSLFVRDSTGNYSPATAGAQDTSLYQLPVSGTLAINDLSGLTRDGDPSAAFTWSGADSLRFGLSADTAAAPWKAVRSLDSVALGATDGSKILAVQFKNIYGKRSPWYFDTTTLDRKAPIVTLDLKAAHSRWDWPVSVSGKSKDSLAGTERVFVVRKRLADGFHFNGASWVSAPDTAKLILGPSDSIFSAPLPATAMTTGDYQFTAYARDLAGNVSTPAVVAVHFEENRVPALAFGNLPDTVLQNQPGNWTLDFGDLDVADSLVTVAFDSPAWLAAAPGPDTAYAPWALHKVFALSGKPLQAHVGTNTVRVLMQDRAGLVFTYTKTIQVLDVNDAPQFADSQAAYSVNEDAVSRWSPKFKDEDPKDTHTLTLLAAPAFARVESLSVVFNPASRDAGNHPVRIAVGDGGLLDTLETLVTVVNVNDPPYAFPSKGWQSPAFWKEDQRDTFTVVVVDMDRNDPVKLVTPLPAFAKVSSTVDSTGFNRSFQFVLAPGQSDTGSISLALTFQDAAGALTKLALIGRVVPFNDTPFAAIEAITTHAGAARIRLAVTDEDGSLEKARFHYRLIGASGDTLRRGITPSSQLALHPLADGAYRIAVMAEDQDGSRQPAFTVQAFSISGATRVFLDSARWHMLGAPHAALPASAFGAGATLASWDETGDDGQPLARYSSGKTVESLKRGKGYWVRLPMPISVSAAQGDLLEGPFTLKLTHSKQDWNQVANPYPYFVDVAASRLTFWEWDAEKRDLVNARGLLKPWAAYWVLAPRDTTLVLPDSPYFPPAGALAKSAGASGAGFRNREDWSVQLALRAGGYHDQANLLGVRSMPGLPEMPSAAAGTDLPGLPSFAASPGLSLPDAPKFGDYVALHFEKSGEGAAQGFANDFHSRLDPEEEWWDISVENTGTGEKQAQLTPAGLEDLAKNGLNLFLVRQGEATRIEPGGSVVLSLESERTYYSLVVTPHSDFAARLKGNFSISQNFPNPVTTFTAFRFFLPQSWDKDGKRMAKDFKLRINLYDYAGRQVAQVASGSFRPGSHTLLWRPVSNGGGALSKGAYIYRLETPGFVKSLKLVVE